ncbi:MAG: class I SAM-dependent methyltransferase [Rhodomicrobium sp.]
MKILFSACPLCGSSELRFLRSADCSRHALYDPRLPPVLHWMQCDACAHVFTDGYFSPAGLEILLPRVHSFQQPGADYERQRYIAARTIERVDRFPTPGDLWLDAGFGNGALLITAEEFGYRPVGVDIRAANVDALRWLGTEAHACDFADFADSRRFAVISMMDVLEHVPFPGLTLLKAHALLAPGGALVVSCPAYNSPLWRALDDATQNPYWAEIEHYHNFSRDRLYALLRAHCFTPRRYAVSERYRACMEIVSTRQ